MALVMFCGIAAGQTRHIIVSGNIYERTGRYGMFGVSVRTTSGAGTVTDSSGRYSLRLPLSDSISFSYQGKSTEKFAVKELPAGRDFNMSLHVDIKTLPVVTVVGKRTDYHGDSLAFRNEYRRILEFEPAYLSGANGPNGVGVDFAMLLRPGKVKRMEAFRRFLEREEQDKYVKYRFNRELVQKITGLESPALDTFMVRFKPGYFMLKSFESEYQYYEYIRDAGAFFSDMWEKQQAKIKL